MKKRVFGRNFNRDTNERKALFKNLMTELVLHEKITTTEEKAKAIRGQVEKLITKAKRKGQQAEYLLQPYLTSDAVKVVISDLSPRFADRPGGYTRIIKLGNRFGDNASMAILELVDKKAPVAAVAPVKNAPKAQPDDIEDLEEIQEAEIVAEEKVKDKKAKVKSTEKEKKVTKKRVTKKKEE